MAKENRLISLDEALKATHSEIYWTESQQAAVRSFLVKQPKVDAVEVVHSWWEKSAEGYKICHHCKADVAIFSGHRNYCPNCGAKMDGDGNGYRFYRNGELRATKIIAALEKAIKYYENGAIIEARDLLLEIADAIDEFESEQEW